MKYAFWILSFILLGLCSNSSAQKIPTGITAEQDINVEAYRKLFWDSLPQPVSWTNDYAWLFSTDQRNALDHIIDSFEKKTTVEICIVTLDTF